MRRFLVAIIIIAGIGIVLYFSLSGRNKSGQVIESSPSPSVAPSSEPDVFTQPVSFGQLGETYTLPHNFSFRYPAEFKVSSNSTSGSNEVITVENKAGSGFQIFTMPFNEPGPITPDRIRKDLPDAVINDPKNANLDGIKALVYYGYDDALGDTFEVWAVHKGALYQIMGPKTAEGLITKTLETWAWK